MRSLNNHMKKGTVSPQKTLHISKEPYQRETIRHFESKERVEPLQSPFQSQQKLKDDIKQPSSLRETIQQEKEQEDNPQKLMKIPSKSSFIQREPILVNTKIEQEKTQNEEFISETKMTEEIPTQERSQFNPHVKDNSEKKVSNDGLTPTEFYCVHYSLIKEIIERLLSVKYGSKLPKAIDDKNLRLKIEAESFENIREYINQKNIHNLDYSHMSEYIQLVYAEAMGFGILENLLNDKDVDEIMVVSHQEIYVEVKGVLSLSEYKFPSFDAALGIVKRIIRPLNKTLDVSNPNVDGQLPNGSRISASIPPLRAEGQISIDIRKFAEKVEPLMTYSEKYQSSAPEMVQFIEACTKARKTMIVSGGTGSGKTTFLNSMSFAFNQEERILVIEDTREIKVQVPHVEYYLRVPANNEGYKGIDISDIVQMCLRKRPERLIVGECRGSEFNEYLNAANTGHDGSVTSIHANSPQELFSRMENMLLKNDETKNMTHEAIMRTLASSVDIIVQLKRLQDGSRRVTHVTEVLGYGQDGFNKLVKMKLAKEDDQYDPYKVYLRDVFYFKENKTIEEIREDGTKQLKVHGQFMSSGYVPFCNRELRRKGVGFDKSFFEKRILMEV